MKTEKWMPVLLVLGALTLAGCGGGGSDTRGNGDVNGDNGDSGGGTVGATWDNLTWDGGTWQ